MRKFLLASAATLAMTGALPAIAQHAGGATTTPAPAFDGTTTVTTTETTRTSTPQAAKGTEAGRTATMTVQQKTTYETWPENRQSEYWTWPLEQQTYFWRLTSEQQQGYWALNAAQRGQTYRMTPAQREIARRSIAEQLRGKTPSKPADQANPPGPGMPTAGVPNPQSAGQAARPAMPADENYQGGPYKGALTPPPADAMNKNYPACGAAVTDDCRNRAGK